MRSRFAAVAVPMAALGLGVVVWDGIVRWSGVPPYVLPSPRAVAHTLVSDWPILGAALASTLVVTFEALVLAAAGGVLLGVMFSQSPLLERAFYPYAVILQVTPVVAIAPLLLIYMPAPAAVLTCAWIVAFFPVLANTTLGLSAMDRDYSDLFTICRASRLKRLLHLQLPTALPAILAGIRIAGGLALIGAVVAEIAAGSAGAGSGLAYRIAEAGYRLNIARMFAALILLSLSGVAVFALLSLLSRILLRRWPRSAAARR